MTFPSDFVWGAATSAYQVEGSPLADGAGASMWHDFAHTPGKVENGDNGDVACDQYNRYVTDIALMRELGLRGHRFSTAWARVLPEGTGRVNAAGLGYYDRFVDELLAAGITPFVTLYHWDLPSALQARGGWENRDSAEWFGEYAATMYRHLGDRVRHWITLNEPIASTHFGYVDGKHAPGHHDVAASLLVAHHLLLAHGTAVMACRADNAGEIGITVNLGLMKPADDTGASRRAAALADAYMNRQFLDPIFGRGTPTLLREFFGDRLPEVSDADRAVITQPIDFLGVNYYNGSLVEAVGEDAPFPTTTKHFGDIVTDLGWPVDPQGLEDLLVWIRDTYPRIPIYITENGIALQDTVGDSGAIHDSERRAFFADHVTAAGRAIDAGVDLRGYFAWSLMDNFEWALGYRPRFGLVRVDFDTQERTIKDSGRFWSTVIAANGLPEPATVGTSREEES